MAHDVFICHPSEDRTTANAVVAKLETELIRCWIAPRDVVPSEEWAEAIVNAIAGSRLVVLVFSEYSNQSRHVMREVEQAVGKGIPILPFRIQDIEPSPRLEYYIGGTHWLDALTPPLEAHLDRLAQTVQIILPQVGKLDFVDQKRRHGDADAESLSPDEPDSPPAEAESITTRFIEVMPELETAPDAPDVPLITEQPIPAMEPIETPPEPETAPDAPDVPLITEQPIPVTEPIETPPEPETAPDAPDVPLITEQPIPVTEPIETPPEPETAPDPPEVAFPQETAPVPAASEPPTTPPDQAPEYGALPPDEWDVSPSEFSHRYVPPPIDEPTERLTPQPLVPVTPMSERRRRAGAVAAIVSAVAIIAVVGFLTIRQSNGDGTEVFAGEVTIPAVGSEFVDSIAPTPIPSSTTLLTVPPTTAPAPTTTVATPPPTTIPPTTVPPTTVATVPTTTAPTTPTTTAVVLVARNDSYTKDDRSQVCFDVTANDAGSAPLTVISVGGSEFGSASAAACGVVYSPPDLDTRTDAFVDVISYTVKDASGSTSSATLTVSVR